MKELLSLVLLSISFYTSCSTNTTSSSQSCLYLRDANVENGDLRHCNCTYELFRVYYSTSRPKLTSFLEKLKAWDCPQFQHECEHRYYNFNRFTFLVYERFCNYSNFIQICSKELKVVNNNFDQSSLTKSNLLKNKKSNNGESDLISHCLQVFSYNYGKPYYEFSRPISYFCDSVWCGFNNLTISHQSPSIWLCLPYKCRVNIIIVMTFCALLSISIIVANFTIICVNLRNPRFPTSQLIYKLSLAFADILVGIFVVPSFIITLYIDNVGPFEKTMNQRILTRPNNDSSNSVTSFDNNANLRYSPTITNAYLDFFGFITLFSLFNSIFTLMFASYDRFRSLSNPLGYKRDKATFHAKIITVALWPVSAVIGLLPIVVPDLGKYNIVAGGILILASSDLSVILSGVGLALPFLIMWIFTVGVHINLGRQMITRIKLLSNKKKHDFSTERQLSKTLSVMIGVFSACILPSLLLVFVPEFISSLNTYNIYDLNVKAASAFLSIELGATIILASNSLWNAFIYSIRNKQFRKDASALYYCIASTLGLVAIKKTILKSLGESCCHSSSLQSSCETNISTSDQPMIKQRSITLNETLTTEEREKSFVLKENLTKL